MSEEMKKVLSDSINSIEPGDGVKERMLANIKKKAELQQEDAWKEKTQESAQPNLKVVKIKRFIRWATPVAACVVIALVGIKYIHPINTGNLPESQDSINEGDDFVSNGNPNETVSSSDEFESRLGIVIDAPPGAKEIVYTIIDDSIAEVYFMSENNYYAIRASKQEGDFSGIDGNVEKEDLIDSKNNAILESVSTLEGYLYRIKWTDGATNYVLVNWDSSSKEDILKLYEKIQ